MNGRDVASAVVQAAPPVGVTGSLILGHPLNDWIMYGTGLYLVCQFIVIAPKVWRTLTGKEKK
ncbi:hypothetical protein KTE28_18345 [Burkholderia multivorans]|uniref:hypothetical protein n=1 Tax=Burkholderia multivorans TaxID=87883 RepID=UPI00158E52D0|nr:hypothetical protein [Burkholderia multivorans]MBU9144948.1 hypothetical protein [Burkholderia multivorans]MBU9376289.1 hypothetical protein [Burkholderia multivorans]MBU9528220.1 hypothetical protein [Burkholderia multivorans]MBU9540061.1 hypothetical protein [Burkholderia multivorans]MDI3300008.1 hypothetical protein [Burkholderia multivorans]